MAAGASIITIVSNARILLGLEPINALEEDVTGLAANFWDTVRQSTIRMGSWASCRKRKLLLPEATAPDWGWAYKFILPSDYLRVISVGENDEAIEYEIEGTDTGTVLLSDEAEIKLRYCFDNKAPGTWDAILVEACTFHLAALAAYTATGSTTLQQSMQSNFAATLALARGVNAGEAPVDRMGDRPVRWSRYSGSGRW